MEIFPTDKDAWICESVNQWIVAVNQPVSSHYHFDIHAPLYIVQKEAKSITCFVTSFLGGAVSYFAIHSPNAIGGGCSHRQVECRAQLHGQGEQTWQKIGRP